MAATRDSAWEQRAARVGLILGPVLALLMILFLDLEAAKPETTRMAAVAVWMAVWWITEAAPLAVTALLPLVLFPVLGIQSGRETAPLYSNSIIFLFLGGFMVALAMERWQLHRRIALRVILMVGGGPRRLVLGFMIAAAFLSMWVSNTATTMMMVPIAMAVARKLEDAAESGVTVALLLGVAYAASVGGLATLVGTPPNPLLAQNLALLFPAAPELDFASWFLFGLPLSVVFLVVVWLTLMRFFSVRRGGGAVDRAVIRADLIGLGPVSFEEKVVLVDFLALAGLWLTREGLAVGSLNLPGWSQLLGVPEFVDDGTVAVAMATLLFLVPSRNRPGERLLDWPTMRKLPWGIVLLFGGGFALASGFVTSGLSAWLGARMHGLAGLPPLVIVMAVCLLMTFLTELTSNTATTQMALPILAAVAVAIGVNPLLLMVPATLSASCAFMLPVATPPNAIIFGTDRIRVEQMARVGLVLNLIGVLLITLCVYTVGQAVLGIDAGVAPEWATFGDADPAAGMTPR